MIKINLLSPSDRLDVKWEKINHLAIADIAAVITIQLAFIFFLLASIEYLNSENGSLDKKLENIQLRTEAKEVKKIENNIKNYEDQLKQVTFIQKNQKRWTQVLDNFSQIVPMGVKINGFSVEQYDADSKSGAKTKKKSTSEISNDSDRYIANIIGTAKTRENLLMFENNLKNSELFINLVTYESNYMKKENVDFKYNVFINKEDIVFPD